MKRTNYSNQGVANWLVVLFVFVACVSLITAYVLAGQLNITLEKKKSVDKEIASIEKEIFELRKTTKRISPLITEVGADQSIAVEGETGIRNYLAEKINQYDLVSKINRPDDIGGENVTLEDIVREAAQRLAVSKVALDRARYDKNSSEKIANEFKGLIPLIENQKNQEISDISDMNNRLASIENKENTDYTRVIDDLKRQKDELENQKPVLEKSFNEQVLKLKSDINFIKSELEARATMEVIKPSITAEVQGVIINPDIRSSYAVINLGKNDKVKPALKFMVFRKDKNGLKRKKGQIEVKKVFDSYSQVSITKTENPLDPITEGDFITNIFYSPKQPKLIVLLGRFERPIFKYNRPEIEKRLNELDIIVEEQVSLKTDFVIMGTKPEETSLGEKNFRLTKKLNVPYIEEQEAQEAFEYYLGD